MKKTEQERFWDKVDFSSAAAGSACLEWAAGGLSCGYGMFSCVRNGHRRLHLAHRIAYEYEYGPIPEGMHVCHRCDNRRCVRAEHLFLGTDRDNNHDMIRKGRARHPSGEESGSAKLTWEQVQEIRRLYSSGVTRATTLAAMFGVCRGNIHAIVTGKTRRTG